MALAEIPHTAFGSVFPHKGYSTPTPQVTPEIGTLSSPAQSFGGFRVTNNAIDEALQGSKLWSIVTAGITECLIKPANPSKEFIHALARLCEQESLRRMLVDWYLNEISSRFRATEVLYASLCDLWTQSPIDATASSKAQQVIQRLISEIDRCTLKQWPSADLKWPAACTDMLEYLRISVYEKWSSLISSLKYRAELQRSIAETFYCDMTQSSQQQSRQDCWRFSRCRCPLQLHSISLEQLDLVGLGGELCERALALAVSRFLAGPAIERRCFQVDWNDRTSCADRLRDWIRSVFAPTINAAMGVITHGKSRFKEPQIDLLVETAVSSLGRKRSAALFDYVKVWPHSQGAIDDIKAYLNLNKAPDKAAICATCEEQLQRRLLHAGASTGEVLSVYVNLINVFKKLDARGVLLEKVSPVIRTYLRARSDAVNVLAKSLFADPKAETKTNQELCSAITYELENAVQGSSHIPRFMDWDDMTWLPDPIDAATNHKSKADDVLSYILSLFDQDELIKEVESVLAERLLSTKDTEIIKETRLLELLKTRLDATKLQNSEVMLKDIRDSVNFERRFRPPPSLEPPTPKEIQAAIPVHGITVMQLYGHFESRIKRTHFQAVLKLIATRRSDLVYPKRGRLPPEPQKEQLKTAQEGPQAQYRILSGSSWPQMQTTQFVMPDVVAAQLQLAEEKFSSLSGQRKLKWRPALARISIALELEDRTIEEKDLPAWRGSVINVFSDHAGSKTAEQLVDLLQMEESLVQDSLAFWISKRVLYQESPGVYAVLERLDMEVDIEQQELAIDTEAVQSLKSQDAVLRENAAMFEAFIANMLGNGGPKEIGGMMGITNMMKMVLPTFTYGDDEVKWLLNQMKSQGIVQDDGDVWSAVNR